MQQIEAPAPTRLYGYICKIDRTGMYGFIRMDSGGEAFVHRSQVDQSQRQMFRTDVYVEFELSPSTNGKRPKALKVKVIS